MDKVLKKQLEAWGTEVHEIVEPDLSRKKQQVKFENTLSITKALMSTMEGREWVYNKLDFCCLFGTPFSLENQFATAFLCGLQEFGHQLYNEIALVSPNEYSLMLQEAAARTQNVPQEKEEN